MRWILPGGAVLNGGSDGDERRVACRPRAAVVVRTRRQTRLWRFLRWLLCGIRRLPGKVAAFFSKERLGTAKLWLEVLTVLVGLIGAILALLAALRK